MLKKYDRDSFYLATKLPIWELKKKEDVKRIFDDQLERLGVDHVDFYLLHSLDKERWQTVKDLDILPFVEAMREEGKIRYICFSFHDEMCIRDRYSGFSPTVLLVFFQEKYQVRSVRSA